MSIFAVCLLDAPRALLKDGPVVRIAVRVINVAVDIVGCRVLYAVLKRRTWSVKWMCGVWTVAGWFAVLRVSG